METLGAVLVILLTPVLWIFSHKYFSFIYFGNIGTSILKELIECFIISLFLVCCGGGLILWLISTIGPVLLKLFGIAFIIFLIVIILKAIKK